MSPVRVVVEMDGHTIIDTDIWVMVYLLFSSQPPAVPMIEPTIKVITPDQTYLAKKPETFDDDT